MRTRIGKGLCILALLSMTIACGDDAAPTAPTPTSPPPTAASASLASLSLGPASGATQTLTVTLAAAVAADTTVTLSSSDPAARVPASVVVRSGQTSATADATISTVSATTVVTITATLAGASRTATITLQATALVSLSFDPASIRSQGESTGTVTLSGPAPTGGATVILESLNRDALKVPSSVVVPAGSLRATFVASSSTIRTSLVVTVEATYLSVRRQATVTVGPPATTAFFTVNSASQGADACALIDPGITQLDCLFDGTGSGGFVSRWRWTLRNGEKSTAWTSSEGATRPPVDCNVLGGGTVSNGTVSLIAELIVTSSDGQSSPVATRTIQLFPNGRCGY